MIRDLLNKVVATVRGKDEDLSPVEQARAEIYALEKQIKTSPTQRRPQLWNRLGDLYARAGDHSAALHAYGRGIDGYLEHGFYDAAAALCRKVIDLQPAVVRARCTLAFLSLGKDLIADAQREIGEYVRAARRLGDETLAARRLEMMAEATDSLETRTFLGEFLLELGDPERADRVLGAVNAERNELVEPPLEDQRERWARLLRVAITDGEEGSATSAPRHA